MTVFKEFFWLKVKLLVDDEVKRADYRKLCDTIMRSASSLPPKQEKVAVKPTVRHEITKVDEEDSTGSHDGEAEHTGAPKRAGDKDDEGVRKLDELGLEVREKGLNYTTSMLRGARVSASHVNHLAKNIRAVT